MLEVEHEDLVILSRISKGNFNITAFLGSQYQSIRKALVGDRNHFPEIEESFATRWGAFDQCDNNDVVFNSHPVKFALMSIILISGDGVCDNYRHRYNNDIQLGNGKDSRVKNSSIKTMYVRVQYYYYCKVKEYLVRKDPSTTVICVAMSIFLNCHIFAFISGVRDRLVNLLYTGKRG